MNDVCPVGEPMTVTPRTPGMGPVPGDDPAEDYARSNTSVADLLGRDDDQTVEFTPIWEDED